MPAPQKIWQAWTTSPQVIAMIDQLLNDYTHQQVADQLNQQGYRSGKGAPFSATIVARLCRAYGLPERYTRLRARGLLTVQEMAARMEVTTKTIKQWRQAGLLMGHAYTDKPEYLYEVPMADTRPSKQQGRKLTTRPRAPQISPNHAMEVQHAT